MSRASVILPRWLAALEKIGHANFKRRLRRRRDPAQNRAKWNAYRAANAERIRETAKLFRERNLEKLRLYSREYRERGAA